jgi:predicted  nucleic acid-binding Zn-ribbon protein
MNENKSNEQTQDFALKQLYKEQELLKQDLAKLKEQIQTMKLEVASLTTHLTIVKDKLKSFDGLIGWVVKLSAAAIIGAIMTFILKGGLLL